MKMRKKRKSRLDLYRSDIFEWIAEQSKLTLAELCLRLIEVDGRRVGSSTLDDWLRSNQITYKKRLTPVNRKGRMYRPNAIVGANARIGFQ